MIKVKKIIFCLCLSVFLFIECVPIYAEQAQVETKGVITFYEETEATTSSDSRSKTSSQSKDLTYSSAAASVEKPKGRYPQLGDLGTKRLMIFGILILIFSMIIFVISKNKKKGEKQ